MRKNHYCLGCVYRWPKRKAYAGYYYIHESPSMMWFSMICEKRRVAA